MIAATPGLRETPDMRFYYTPFASVLWRIALQYLEIDALCVFCAIGSCVVFYS